MKNYDWMSQAACRDTPTDVFFPSSTGHAGRREAQEAIAICAQCPVVIQCRTMRDTIGGVGIWAGELRTHNDRLPLRDHAPHGTEAAYRRHKRANDKPCFPCQQAAKVATAERKARRRSA